MPFVDTDDDVFLVKSHSRRGMRLSTIMSPSVHKNHAANDTAEDLVPRMRPAFPSFDEDVLLHGQLRFLFPKS